MKSIGLGVGRGSATPPNPNPDPPPKTNGRPNNNTTEQRCTLEYTQMAGGDINQKL